MLYFFPTKTQCCRNEKYMAQMSNPRSNMSVDDYLYAALTILTYFLHTRAYHAHKP
jgi:hypothetical protein